MNYFFSLMLFLFFNSGMLVANNPGIKSSTKTFIKSHEEKPWWIYVLWTLVQYNKINSGIHNVSKETPNTETKELTQEERFLLIMLLTQ